MNPLHAYVEKAKTNQLRQCCCHVAGNGLCECKAIPHCLNLSDEKEKIMEKLLLCTTHTLV